MSVPTTAEIRSVWTSVPNALNDPDMAKIADMLGKGFDSWYVRTRHEAAADALTRLAKSEQVLADTIGADIDTRGRTRLMEAARAYRREAKNA